MFTGGDAQKTGQMVSIREARDIAHFTDQSQGVTQAGSNGAIEKLGFAAILDEDITGFEECFLPPLDRLDVLT